MIHIQKQVWKSHTRYIILDTGGGSLQLELYPEKQDWGGTACIYALFVCKENRNKGVAKRLVDTAERIAAEEGHKDIILNYDSKDTPIEIFEWYKRRGYEVEYAQMTKKINEMEVKNGIIIDGVLHELAETKFADCMGCSLYDLCNRDFNKNHICLIGLDESRFMTPSNFIKRGKVKIVKIVNEE